MYAVQSERAGSSAVGSVSHALVVASTASVLVAKGEPKGSGPLRAVFATDHSPFSALCLDRFLTLAPKGIEEIDVVSAWEIDDREAQLLGEDLPKLGGDVGPLDRGGGGGEQPKGLRATRSRGLPDAVCRAPGRAEQSHPSLNGGGQSRPSDRRLARKRRYVPRARRLGFAEPGVHRDLLGPDRATEGGVTYGYESFSSLCRCFDHGLKGRGGKLCPVKDVLYIHSSHRLFALLDIVGSYCVFF